jgi:general nucleoside transport system permease protein
MGRRLRRTLAQAAANGLEALVVPAGAALVSIVLFGIFVALAGHSPIDVYSEMYRGAFGTWFSFQNSLLRAAPLMLTGLCTALPARWAWW